MLEKDTLVKVTNRDNGTVGYLIPELGNLYRSFASGETKEVPMDELRKLSWIPGGLKILSDYLVIENEEAAKELIPGYEPEYFYTKEDVKGLLLTGTLNQLQDCLNFAPVGVVNLVKDYAVELKINDIQKRDLIHKMTGFDVTKAIMVNEETLDETEEEGTKRTATVFKAVNTAANATPVRTTAEPKIIKVNK